MSFLPVAQRELLTASRRRGTFRARVLAAGLASVVGAFLLTAFRFSGPGMSPGLAVFGMLAFGCLILALLSGVFLTADALSSERRDGTLGLLFLTETGPGDVILGKLLALGLNALGAILAVAPILGVAWVLGGLTGGQLLRTVATILNALFFSLSAGLAVSAGEREQGRALAFTALGLVVATVLGSVVEAFNPRDDSNLSRLLLVLTGLSPLGGEGGSDDVLYQRRPGAFWVPFLVAHGLGWFWLLLARNRLRRRWHGSDPVEVRPARRPRPRRLPHLLDQNPIQAWVARSPGPGRLAWAVALASLGLGIFLLLRASLGGKVQDASFLLFALPSLLLKGLFAWSATAFLAEAKRTQTLELLLTTPLKDRDLISGQESAILNTYAMPWLVLYLGEYLSTGGLNGGWWILGGLSALGTFVQCLAMVRLGAWFALTERLPTVAVGKTFVLGAVLPSALNWVCCSGLVLAIVLFGWAANRLARPLRTLLTSTEASHR